MAKTYAILGAAGCFSVQTALWLLDHAEPSKVIGVGRHPLPEDSFSLGVHRRKGYEYHAYHVTYEWEELLELLDRERPEVIINFAAQGEGALSWKKSWRYFETNCVGLTRLVEHLGKRDWLERFIHIGTSELYGSVGHAVNEDHPIKPTNPYAVSKAAFDMHLECIRDVLGFRMNIIRPSNAYCPAQRLHRVIPKAVVLGLQGKKLPLQGGGAVRKSYFHARDLARAIYLVSENAPLGAIYNCGPKEPISIREIVEKTAQALGMPFDDLVEMAPARQGEDACYWLDSSRLMRDTGWAPQISLEEGLAEMVEWGRAYLGNLQEYPTDYVLRA